MAKTNEHIIPVAVFDISSSSVAGAHTLIPKGSKVADAKVSILASTRIFSEIKEEINIERFVEYLASNEYLLSKIYELKGKRLGCWCDPLLCHGTVLAEIANE
jgi:hypothetical protein